MMIFVAIAIAAFMIVAGGFLFGHDHDFDHGIDHDLSHEGGVDTHGIIGIFSLRVVFTFVMGFGAAGAIALHYGAGYPIASVIGVAVGMVLAALMYGIMLLFIEQQASSVTPTDSLVGCTGTVTVPIDKDGIGEIGVSVGGEYRTYAARTQSPTPLAKGHSVRIVNANGSVLTVDENKAQ
jgi:membrane protein implicated in regulation of membrane protease activity